MFYIVISLIIVILICTRQIFAKVYYPEFVIYKEDSLSAVKRLANNLNKYNFSALIPNVYLIKKNLFKYYYFCNISKKKNQYLPVDVFFYNNFKNINKIFYKYDFFKLTKVSHYKSRLRIIEITKTILAYDSFIDEKTLFKHLKAFLEIEEFNFDELYCLKEAVILSIFENLSKAAQEIVLIKNFKNKPNLKDLNMVYQLSVVSVKIENLIKSLFLIDNINETKFYNLSKIYNNLKNEYSEKDSLILSKIICKYSKRNKINEIEAYNNAKEVSFKLNIAFNRVFSDYFFSLKNNKITVSTKKIIVTICTFFTVITATIIGVLPLFLNIDVSIYQIVLLSISSLSSIYYLLKNSFLNNYLSLRKNLLWIYGVSFVAGLINIILVISSFNMFLAIYSSIVIFFVPVCYLGKKFQHFKIKFSYLFIKQTHWKEISKDISLEFGYKNFPHVNVLCGNRIAFVVDSYGRNYIYHENKGSINRFFDPFNMVGHYFKTKNSSFSYYPNYNKNEYLKTIMKKDNVIFKSKNGCMKIMLLKKDDAILYEIFSKESDIVLDLNLKTFNFIDKNEKYIIFNLIGYYLAIMLIDGNIYFEENGCIYIKLLSNKLSVLEFVDSNLNQIYEKIEKSKNNNYIAVSKKFNLMYKDNLSLLINNEEDFNLYIYLCTILNYPILKEKENYVCLKNIAAIENDIDIIKLVEIGKSLNDFGQNIDLFIFYKSPKLFENLKNYKNLKLIKMDKNFIKNEQKLKYKIYTFLNEENLNIQYLENEENSFCKSFEIKMKNQIFSNINFGKKMVLNNLSISINKNEIAYLSSLKGGMILGEDAFYLNGKNKFISSRVNLFAFCGSKNYVFKPSFLKNALNWNNSHYENVANIEIGHFYQEYGLLYNGVCFFSRFRLNFNNIKAQPVLLYFEKELSKNGIKSMFMKCTKLDEYTLLIKLEDLKESIFLKTNFPFELILNKYNVQNFSDKDISYFRYRDFDLFFPCLILSYKGYFGSKSEQEFIIVYSSDKEKIINFDFKNFDKLKNFELALSKVKPSLIISSKDYLLDLVFNELLINNIKQYLDSHIDKQEVHGVIVEIDAICLKAYLSINSDYVKEKILYLSSYMFIEGDFLYDFHGFSGIRKKEKKDIFAFIDLVNAYLSYTQNYEILYEKIPYIVKTKYSFYSFTIFSETLIQHIMRAFNVIKNFTSLKDALCLINMINNMSCFFDNEYIVEINKYKVKCNEYLSKISFNTITENADLIMFLDYLLPNKNIELMKRIDLKSLSDIERINYYKLLSFYENKNMYNYDNKINPLKTQKSFTSIQVDAYYYLSIEQEYLGIKKDIYSIECKKIPFSLDLKMTYLDMGKDIYISFMNNNKPNSTIIDKYEYLNKKRVLYSEVKEKITFCCDY